MKEWIRSHPLVFGVLVSVLICVGIMTVETWFPGIDKAWDQHDALLQAVYFTVFAVGAWLYGLWRWRHRRAFWASVSVFFMLHVLSVLFYTTQVGRILVWQWLVLLVLESYAIAFFVDWSTRRFGHFR